MAFSARQFYDVIVVGLGAMGSATAFHLAKRGAKVLGLDRFTPPHSLGSSHGQSRIIREAYYEDPRYVPLLRQAYVLWAELEEHAQDRLFLQTGGVMIGREDSVLVRGAQLSAETHGLPHEILSAAEIQHRFPALQPPSDMRAVWEPRAGVLYPERCITAHLDQARRHGATLQLEEPVRRWHEEPDHVQVETGRGCYRTAKLILTAGSWITGLVPELALPLTVERQPLFWFADRGHAAFGPDQCPIYIWEYETGRYIYGFPSLGPGVKLAYHHAGLTSTPETLARTVTSEEAEAILQIGRRLLPDLGGELVASTVCMYTTTPDHHFYLGAHPQASRVLVASPCSGHGFKFSCVIGEILSDLASDRTPPFDLELFSPTRPGLRK